MWSETRGTGSLVDRNQCEHEPYSGMASGPWQKKLVQMVFSQDDVQGNRSIFGATPEATQHEQILTLEEGNMKVKSSRWTVPNRQVWGRWVEGRVDQLQAGLDSEEGAFQDEWGRRVRGW